MSAVESTPRPLLSEDEIRTLNAARTLLRELSRRALSQACHATNDDDARPSGLGYFAGKASMAQDAIFETLNAAHSYCHAEFSDDLLHNREGEPS